MAQTWRATEKARTRQKYLDAAVRLFARRGFHAVSIDELGSAVGLSGPALYRHFPGKEAMLGEILVSTSERLLVGLEKTLEQQTPDEETLRNLVHFHLDFAIAERDIIRIQDRELPSLPEEQNRTVRRLQNRYLDGWVDVLLRIRPEVTRADARVQMHAVFGILNSTAHNSMADRSVDVRGILEQSALAVLLGPVSPRT